MDPQAHAQKDDTQCEFEMDNGRRAAAVVEQLTALKELNDRFSTGYTNLSEVVAYGRKYCGGGKQPGLSGEEVREYDSINRLANSAKHRGLGAPGAAEIERDGSKSRRAAKDAARWEGIDNLNSESGIREIERKGWDESLGNCIGELETLLARRLGRPLVKNEPRYRWAPRRGGGGLFTAIVCLDALDAPAELIGDSYAKKKDAQHSAALQGVNHLEALGCSPVVHHQSKRAGSVGENTATKDTTADLVERMKGKGMSLSGGKEDSVVAEKNTQQKGRVKKKGSSSASNSSKQDSTQEADAVPQGGTTTMPSDATILRVLSKSQSELRLREIYLLALNRDPKKEQMGSGVRSVLRKQLETLKLAGKIERGNGRGDSWVVAGR